MLKVENWQIDKQKLIKDSSMEKFSFTSPERVTKIEKIVISSAVSQATTNKQLLDNTATALNKITGQKPIINKAKRSVTAFKLREGMPIGCRVTLRGKKAWNFLFKLILLYIPRIRDLRGISPSGFDRNGNYNMGVSDLTIFHEVPYDLIFKNQGLQINIVFSSKEKVENKYLLDLLNFPFKGMIKITNKQTLN
ncbi:MAG: 50S ribosomal protein L5 [Mycoplasmataceae bacterium]|nr:MAG: 50S ribosomal protein L5 [Mycoplasmataceae bacterium]